MQSFLTNKRASGVLAHITSLPSSFGIGDLGSSAFRFIDFLERSGQTYWQILPTGPTSLIFDSSPYMSSSAFAGSSLLISPQHLRDDGLIDHSPIESAKKFSIYFTEYDKVSTHKKALLEEAFDTFSIQPEKEFESFLQSTPWLADYALFMTLKEVHRGAPWYEWPEPLSHRSAKGLKEFKDSHRKQFNYFCFEQYIFFTQWNRMKKYAKNKGVRLIGDIPIYIALDSADVWAHQGLFELDEKTLKPLFVSGVPPDYFSTTGQRWGNPLYRWNSRSSAIQEKLTSWWSDRLSAMFSMVDVTRIDHFRGFESYWSIPAEEDTAVKGTWLPGPGLPFFKNIESRLGKLNIIAEDLGDITSAVVKLRNTLNFPGMKVLQFAFDGNRRNPFLPYNYHDSNYVVYTGTHDNDTTTGWFLSEHLDDTARNTIKKMANRTPHDASPIHLDLIYLALSSSASLAITPLQDFLGFGSDCRMNTPGVAEGNWRWRCAPEFLTEDLAGWIKEMTYRFGR